MSRYEDLKKKRNTKPVEDKAQKQTTQSRYQNIKANRGERNYGVDDNFINTFIQDASNFLTTSQEERKNLTWQSGTDKTKSQSRNDKVADLGSRAATIRAYLNANRGRLDEKTYNELATVLEQIDSGRKDVFHSFRNAEKYYSQWDSEEVYNKYQKEQKDYSDMVTFDTAAGEKEIEDLGKFYDDAYHVESWHTEYSTRGNNGLEDETDRRNLAIYNELVQKYGSLDGLDKLIQERKLYLANAKRLQEGVRLASVSGNGDFSDYSGYAGTKSDGFWGKLTSQYGMEYDDLTYEYINNQNGIRDEIKRKHTNMKADSVFDDGESIFEEKGYDYIHEDEVAIYNYYYAKEGKEAAEKYLDSIQETLNARKAGKMYANMEDKTLLELAFGVAAGLDQFESGAKGAWNAISGNDDYIPQSATQMASGMVREDLADESIPVWYNFKDGKWEDKVLGRSVGQVAYDAITTTANMAPSIMTSWALSMVNPVAGGAWVTAGQIAGTGMMGASAAGNAYQEVINLGYDKDQARAYAGLVGASEAGLQYLLGGIGKLGGKLSGNAVTKIMNGVDNAFARTAIKLGGNMLSEGLEEGLQEVLTPWFQNLVLHTENDVDWNEVAYSSLLGALTAGFMEGTSTIAGEVNTYKTGKNLQKADISAQRLSELGKTFAADTVAYQLAGRVNENTGAYTMGRLFNEIGATLSEQNINEITNALVAKGMDESTARKNAKALAYVVEGGQLSERQIAVIEANEVLAEVARTTLIDANTTWNQRSNGYNEMLKALADEMTSPKASQAKQAQQGVENTSADGSTENGTESHSEAESVDVSPSKVRNISSIDNGNVTIKLEDDSEVSVKDADLDPDDGVRIETIASIDGISATDASFIFNTLRTSTGASAQMDSLGAKEAYKYGFYGFSQEHMTKHGVFANSLTDAQRQAIYETGKNARQQQIEKATPKKTKAKERGVYFDHGGGNVVAFKDADKSLLAEEKRSAGVQVAVILNKLGIGGDIYFFESYRNERGQLVYKDKNGKEKKAPNGWYSPGDGSIHIDLNAGKGGKGFVLFTLAHELTHFIEQWSPQKYKVLADFLVENYEKGQSMDGLVRAKQAKLSAQRGKKVSYKEAYSEVVADSMEAMLADGNVMEKLMELKAKDNSLFMKMKQFFDNLLAKIRNVYNGLTPDSTEGQAVLEMTDSIEKIQQLFAEALVDASENFQAEEKNTTEDGGVDGEYDIKLSERDETAYKQFARKVNSVINQAIAGKGNIDGKVQVVNIMPVGPKLAAMVAKASGYAIDISNRGIALNTSDVWHEYKRHTSVSDEVSRDQVVFTKRQFQNAVKCMISPDIVETIFADTNNPTQRQSFAYAKKTVRGHYVVVEAVGGKKNPYIYPVMIVQFSKGKWNKMMAEGKSLGEILHEGETQKLLAQDVEKNKKSRVTAAQFASYEAIANTLRSPQLDTKVSQPGTIVKSESAEALDIEVDESTESVAPAVQMSERTWTESDYVQEREIAAEEISKAIGVSVKKAKAYIDSVNSIAKMIVEDRVRLDYFSSPGRSSFVGNVEYGGSFDFSTLCKKRRLLTGTFTAIQKALPNTALTANEILDIRNRMKDAGLEVSCGLCYVEGSRANMGQFAKEFLKLYKQYYPDAWQPNMADVNTPDGIEWVRINHPECYEQYEYFWNHYGTLKPGDKNLFASQQKPKLYQLHTEYKGEILDKFNDDDNVEEKNLNGGIRLQSFSDFEIVHLIDTMQIIMDMSRVGLAGQAYTKVPDFAWALGDTGLKINLSLIAKGVDENGRLIFDDVEGMPIDTAVSLRNRYSKNVGTILVAFNDEQLLAAMADERVDFIIPFHRSQWKKSQYGAMGLPAKTKDYTYMQNEKYIKPQYHEYRGRMVKDKATNYMPNEYWDFSKSGKENAEAYLEMCARNNKRPKFYKLLQNNGDGSYSLKADGSTDGYWKLLIDFKMYDNSGKGSPQMPVKPDFNMEEATRMLNDYSGGHSNFPVAQGVVDEFVQEYKDSHEGAMFSDRDDAPTFYSQMAKVVDGMKQEKFGASSVISMLRGKGVKAEEIKWSGIETFLEGKKSVTKAELQEFIAGSMLQIDEEILDNKDRPYTEDQQKRLDEYEAKRDEVVQRLAAEWKNLTGEEFPIRNAGAGLESSVVNKIIDANKDHKDASFEGRLLKKLRKDLEEVISNNDDFGFDSWKDALRSIHRHRRDFIKSYEMSTNDKAIIVKYCNALNAYNELPNKISDADTDRLRAIARETDPWTRKIMEVKHEHNEEEAKYMTNWGQYTLKGGKNYREMLFRIPGSAYSNVAMFGHWKDRSGVLAHARVQDMDTFIGKMLFIEEIQSDWHNAGHKDGYDSDAEKVAAAEKLRELKSQKEKLFEEMDANSKAYDAFLTEYWETDMSDAEYASRAEKHQSERLEFLYKERELNRQINEIEKDIEAATPDAPFKETYHEYVLKRLIREAAEQDYDSIGWTTAETQDDRWQNNLPHKEGTGKSGFLKAYTIEYDQDIPKFMAKFGKKLGTTVGKTVLDNGTEVWSMAITDEMKESVMTEGQPLYQDRTEDSVSNRSLLANAFEGLAQNEIERNKIQEYRGKIDLINAEEQKLSELNEQIKELSFAKGPRDTKKIRDLQFEARQTANRISVYDKQLLRLEASKPLQDVLTREKKMAYKRAEQKGKEALAAYKERAAKTQRDLLEKWQESRKKGIESREKTAMRHKIQSVVGELNQLLLSNDKKRHVPDSLKKAVADALALVNMDTVGAEERAAKYAALIAKETDPDKIDAYTVTMENILRQGEKMGQRLKDLRDAYEEIQESDDPDIANAYDPVIAGSLKELAQSIGNTSLRNMTIEQLQDVYDMYKMVLTRVRDANKTFIKDMKETISNLASRVVGEVRRVGGEHKYRAAILDFVKKFGWNNLKPVYAFEHIGSGTLTDVFNNVRAGEDVWAVDVTEARKYYLDKSKKYDYDSWDFKKKYRFKSASELEFDLTLEQILSLYAYSKREQSHDHLRLGGFVFDSNIETYKEKDKGGKSILKYKVNTADAHQITPEILANIIGNLSDEQMSFVDDMQEYLSTVMGAKGNEVTMAMYGVKLFKEKFYFPLKSAKQFMFEQNEVSGEVRIKNSGFTNKVVAKANNPVILSNFMDVWAGHVNDMSMYHAFVLRLEDFNRVFNYNSPKQEGQPPVSVKGTIQNAYGPSAVSYVRQLITDLNGGARTDPATGFINKMIGLFKKGSVFASLSVVVQQPSAIARAAALVDTKYFIGPKVDHKRHKALWDEVKQYAPVAIIKEMGYFDTNMGKSTQDFILGKEYEGVKEKLSALVTDSNYRDEVLSKAPALADEIAWCSIWEAVKREIKAKNPSMDVKSEAFLKMAGDRFTEVIVKTQVYDSVLSRSGMMRSKDTGMKMATAFMAEPTTSINMVADALLQGKRGNRKYARAAIGAVIASQILNSILVSFVYAGRDDDEDETYLEKYIGTLSGEILDSLNPAGYIPFIKDIMSIVQGYDVERSDMAVVSDLWNAIKNLSKENVSAYRKVEGFAGSIAQIFGLPVKNIMRDARGIYQTVMSFVNGQPTTGAGIGHAVKGAITGKDVSDSQQLYEAYLNSDAAQISRVKGRFKDQNAINNAIRKGLRENDPRIREAAIAWNANDLDEYMRIAKEIIAEKHFVQDDVVMAIRSEANALAPDAETETKSKAKGLFTAEKFAEAISQGDQAMANAIKVDIIRTAEKNGKTAEDAVKSFVSSAKTELKELFLSGDISEQEAINALTTYCGSEQDDAMADVQYWAFKQEYPDVFADDQWFDTYYEKVADSGISIDVYMEYRNTVATITGENKKAGRMAVINSLPISSAQKDALYLAEGWAKSKLYEAPWH